jgi:hypothetical protein
LLLIDFKSYLCISNCISCVNNCINLNALVQVLGWFLMPLCKAAADPVTKALAQSGSLRTMMLQTPRQQKQRNDLAAYAVLVAASFCNSTSAAAAAAACSCNNYL